MLKTFWKPTAEATQSCTPSQDHSKMRSCPKGLTKPKGWKPGLGRVGDPNRGLGLYLDNYSYSINFNYCQAQASASAEFSFIFDFPHPRISSET